MACQADIGQQAVFNLLVGRAGAQVVGEQQQFGDHGRFPGLKPACYGDCRAQWLKPVEPVLNENGEDE